MYCRIQKMPKALAAPGRIIAQYVFTRCSRVSTMKTGIKVTAAGIIMVPSTKANSLSRPGAREYFANAYPPIEHRNSARSVCPPAMTHELTKARAMGVVRKTSAKFCTTTGSGTNCGGSTKICALVLNAEMRSQ